MEVSIKSEWQQEGHLPDHTPKPQDKEASPETVQLSRSPETTCLWLHKTAIPE